MKNLSIGLIILAVVVVGYFVLGHKATPASTAPFKIGAVLPLTGPLGDFGQEINRGALLAVGDLKAQGITVSYDPQDDAFDPKQSVSASNKLLQSDNVQAAFTAIWEEAEPVTSIFNQAQIPLLVAWDNNKPLQQSGPYIFSIGFSTEKDGALMADYAYDKLGLRKIATIEAVDPVVKIMADSFVAEFVARGGAILTREPVQPDITDFRTAIPKVESVNPQGIYFLLIPPQSATFLPQLRRTNFSGALLSGDSLIQSDIQSAGNAANGIYYSTIYANDPASLSAKYKTRFGTDPADTTLVSFGYDGVKVLVKGLQDAARQGIPLRDALTHVQITSFGTSVNMNGSQFSERVERVFHIVNGQSVEMGK